MPRVVAAALVLALTASACTVGLPLTTSGVIWAHNGAVDHRADKWSYGTAVEVSIAVGVVIDLVLLRALGRAWSRPMT